MSGDKDTRRVFRALWPWNDEKEERWLAAQARSGWHLRSIGFLGGYVLERGEAAEIAYRLDVHRGRSKDREEYLGLFRDAGWEHVGSRGSWHYFRKAVVDGKVPEIYTDPESRIGKYQRVVALLAPMLLILAVVVAPRWPTQRTPGHPRLVETVYASAFFAKLAVMAFIAYALVRLVRNINRLKKSQR